MHADSDTVYATTKAKNFQVFYNGGADGSTAAFVL
jgi:hypothetical protein